MITSEGTEIPDKLLIGITRGQWPVRLFYNDTSAADWLVEESDRRVYRVKLEVVEQLVHIPPVPARLESRPVRMFGERRAVPCALGNGDAPVENCPCVNCSLARPESPNACSELPGCRDGDHSASCEVASHE